MTKTPYRSLQEFYPFYLSEHQNTANRVLHFTGAFLTVLAFITGILFHNLKFWLAIPFMIFGFAWVGHFFFEKNKPATFKYFFYSIACDFILFWELANGTQQFKVK